METDPHPGDTIKIRGISKTYTYCRKIELHALEDTFVLSDGIKETQWPASCCSIVEAAP